MLMLEDITNAKRLKSTMARYMTKELADKLLEEGEEALGGKLERATVLFTDIRSFTSISERIGPQETVRMLNEYFSIMVDIILEKGGILDKYIGDAIMAVFGAPFRSPDDADHAVGAAIGMLQALDQYNSRRALEGQELIHMGVGVSTDDVLSGNIGSLKRMDYTVIGDGVNLASRLESANKQYGTQILVAESTVRDLKGDYRLREVDRMRVKGKDRPVGVYEVLDHVPAAVAARLPELLERFEEALGLYRARDWGVAEKAFAAIHEGHADEVSRIYQARCVHFARTPPPTDWDGVWTMTEK
jgi:adenylate cyclase